MKNKFTYLFALIFFAALIGSGSSITVHASSWHSGVPPFFNRSDFWNTGYMPAHGEKGMSGKSGKYKINSMYNEANSYSVLQFASFLFNDKKNFKIRSTYLGSNTHGVVDIKYLISLGQYPHYRYIGNNYYQIVGGEYGSNNGDNKLYHSADEQYKGYIPADINNGYNGSNTSDRYVKELVKIINNKTIKVWVSTSNHEYGPKEYLGVFHGRRLGKNEKVISVDDNEKVRAAERKYDDK